MNTLVVVSSIILGSSLASIVFARMVRRPEPFSPVNPGVRAELEQELDSLRPEELQNVLRVARRLREESDAAE